MKPTAACAFIFPEITEFPGSFKDQHTNNMELTKQVCAKIAGQVRCGKTEFLTLLSEGMAEWGATLILALKEQMPEVKLTCVLPCETNGEQLTIKIKKNQQYILSNADRVAYINREYPDNRPEDGYRYLVDHADYIMAFYCGDPNGTVAHTLSYAQKQKKWITILSPSGTPAAPLADSLIAAQ